MKPNIDLNNPAIKTVVNHFQNYGEFAISLSSKLENAVCPVYRVPKYKKHPIQLGTCVLVKIKNELFFFSASHVFFEIKDSPMHIGIGNKLYLFKGDIFCSAMKKSPSHQDDPIDAAVFHIENKIPNEILNKLLSMALPYDDLDLNYNPIYKEKDFAILIGFRSSRSNKLRFKNKIASSQKEKIVSFEYDKQDYKKYKLNPDIHLALSYENKIPINNQWQNSRTPKGMSGGAIIRIKGLHINPFKNGKDTFRPQLSAIFIEHKKDNKNDFGVIIGTKVNMHISLIDKYLPSLLK